MELVFQTWSGKLRVMNTWDLRIFAIMKPTIRYTFLILCYGDLFFVLWKRYIGYFCTGTKHGLRFYLIYAKFSLESWSNVKGVLWKSLLIHRWWLCHVLRYFNVVICKEMFVLLQVFSGYFYVHLYLILALS